jgi:hypothetical protein
MELKDFARFLDLAREPQVRFGRTGVAFEVWPWEEKVARL